MTKSGKRDLIPVQILVRLKAGVLDVQGKAVERGLNDGGDSTVSSVRVGRLIELDIGAADAAEARAIAERLCATLLVNPTMEQAEIRVGEGGAQCKG